MPLFFSQVIEGTKPSTDATTTMGGPSVKRRLIPAQGSADGEIKEKSSEASANTSLKRLACDVCRDRKVKCGREHPTCNRCAKVGNMCRYSSRSKPVSTKPNLSHLLMTLNKRLSQSFSLLAFTVPGPSPLMGPKIDLP